MSDSLISILMPVKNALPYLTECLDTIVQQRYPHWELVAVDDHSEDSSGEILKKYARHDARIRYYANTGQGIIEALKLAFAKSKGLFITRMDADDRMHPDKLAVMYQQLTGYGKGYLATGLVKYFAEQLLGAGYLQYADWLNQLARTGINFSDIYKECVIPSPCWMLHRSDLEKCGAFDSDIYPEDYDLCFRMYAAGLQVIPATTILHYWRDYATRTSRTHPHYADNRFLELKLFYFLKIDYQSVRPLVLWGAGRKGKKIARILIEKGVEFHWICDNDKKIGHHIYGQLLKDTQIPWQYSNPQIIIAVANPSAQENIRQQLMNKKKAKGSDFFFFC